MAGDVVGMLLCIDEREVAHNSIHFSLNGCWQGAAFTAFPSAHYYPAVSAYQHAQLHCRFQPPYIFPPPWMQRQSGSARVSWRVALEAAVSQTSYRYWRRDKKEGKSARDRRGARAEQRTLYESD